MYSCYLHGHFSSPLFWTTIPMNNSNTLPAPIPLPIPLIPYPFFTNLHHPVHWFHAYILPCVHTHNPILLYTSPIIIIPISPFIIFFLIPLNPFPLITLSTYSAFAHHKLPHLLSLIHMTCRHDLFDACMTSLDPLISQVCKCVRVMNWKRFSEVMRLKSEGSISESIVLRATQTSMLDGFD